MKKSFLVLLAAVLLSSLVFAGGASEKPAQASEKVVTTVCRASYANEEWYNKMNADFEKETGIRVDVQPTPGNDEDHVTKVNVDLLAGGNIDVIPTLGPKTYQSRVEAGFFAPLADVAKAHGLDVKAIWGGNVPYEADGNYYAFPTKQELYCVFYNKAIFDAAGVPYPQGPWTWDEYVETAKKLTDPKKGIYGSFMNADNPWQYLPARQSDEPLYKEDGTCNFDTPEFRAAVKWYYDLGNTLKVQPSVAELKAENASWNYYALAGDHLAMFPQGNWFTRLLNSQSDYPKDWDYGVAPLPANEGGKNNLVSLGYVSVNKNAAHPEEAAIYAIWLGQNQWKYEGGIPALATLTEEQQNQVFSGIAEASHGQVTVSELYENMINTGLAATPGDIVGTAAEEYNTIVREELQAYCMDLQSLDKTMANITSRANEAIANAK
jgi:ABC-type sugar transport system, periplasmic component